MHADHPDQLNIPTSHGSDPAEYVGPGMWGAIYRSKEHTAYYRVLSAREASLESMQGARDWAESQTRPRIAAVTDVNIWFEEDSNYSYMRYAATGAQTLQDILFVSRPSDRIKHLATALRCLSTWRNFAGSHLSPTPAEIVFREGGDPVILAAPFRPALTVEDVFSCPTRALFASPEAIRGTAQPADDAESLYGFVAMAALALHRPPELAPEEALLHGANRTLLSSATVQGTIPRWMDKLDAIQEMRKEVFHLLAAPSSERRGIDPDDLAARLEEWARNCDPITAVISLHKKGRLEDACNLLREILGYEESYELLILGAGLSEIRKSALEGIEYLERALAIGVNHDKALALQLHLIAQNPKAPPTSAGQETQDWGSRLKSLLWRDFDELPARLQREHEHEVAQFLIHRSEFDEAIAFIHPRQFDAQNVHLWWKFDIALDYTEALMGKGALPQAHDSLDGIRIGIEKARGNKAFEADKLDEFSRRREDLEHRLSKIRWDQQRAAGGRQ